MSKTNYTVPAFADRYYEPSTQIEYLKQFRDLCHQHDVLTQNTRLDRYQNYLEATVLGDEDGFRHFQHSNSYPFTKTMELWLYVLREIHELMWIFRGVEKTTPIGLRKPLKKLVGGSDFAALDRNSASRDAQFELRIASYFCQRDYKVDLSTGCDVVADLGKFRYFVECKRIAGPKQLKKRTKEARRQLSNRMDQGKNTFGIVAADVTKVAYPHNGLTFGMTSEHSRDVIRNDLQGVSRAIDQSDFTPRILLIWLQIHIANLAIYPSQPSSRFSSIFSVNPKQGFKARKSFKNLKAVLEVGDEPDPLSNPGKPIKLRDEVALPKGTMWRWKDNLVEAYIEGITLPELPEDETVLWLKTGGDEYEFSFADFVNAITKMPSSAKDTLSLDPVAAQLEIACWLYGIRFPLVIEHDG